MQYIFFQVRKNIYSQEYRNLKYSRKLVMQLGQTFNTLENTIHNSWCFCDMRGETIFIVCKSNSILDVRRKKKYIWVILPLEKMRRLKKTKKPNTKQTKPETALSGSLITVYINIKCDLLFYSLLK